MFLALVGVLNHAAPEDRKPVPMNKRRQGRSSGLLLLFLL